MKFLITGGRGFIGSHFVELILNLGHEVIDIDKMTYASNKTLPFDNNSNYELINEDIVTIQHLPVCDIIVNFAAESHVDNSIESPAKFLNTNVYGVFNILNLLRGKVYKRPLFVHISTDEVYGDINDGERNEESLLNPSNPYSATKAAAEMLIFSYARTFGIKYQIVRSTNNYGPRQYQEKLIPKIIYCLNNKQKIPIHGDGSYIRDWLYVKDNVQAIYKICFSKNLDNIWNVSAYNYRKNIDIVQEICDWFGIKNYLEYIEYIENRLGQDYRYSISSQKIRNMLRWAPEHDKFFNFLTGTDV